MYIRTYSPLASNKALVHHHTGY